MVIKGEKDKGGKAVPKVVKEKEKCVCEICTCGRHRCPHNNFRGTDPNISSSEHQAHSSECATSESREQYKAHTQVERQKMKRPQTALRVEGGEKMELSSSYREEFQEKEMEELKRFKHQDHVHWQDEAAGLDDSAAGLRSRSMLRERVGTGGPDDTWGISMHEEYSTGSRDNVLGSLDTSLSTQNLSESQAQQQMSSSMTTSTSSSMLARSQQNVSDSTTTVHGTHSTDAGGGAPGGDGKFMSQLQATSLKTKKQLIGGKLVDVPDTSRTYSEAVSSTSKSQSKYSADEQVIDGDRQRFEQSNTLSEQGSSLERTGADGKTVKISSSARDVTSSTDGTPIVQAIRSDQSSDSRIIHPYSQDLTSSNLQSSYSTQQQLEEQTRQSSEQRFSSDRTIRDGQTVNTSVTSGDTPSHAYGVPGGSLTSQTQPRDSSLPYSQGLNTSTSSVSQSAYSTQQLITEHDNQRFEQTNKLSENMASFEKTGSDGKPIRTTTSSREVTSSSDGTPIGTTSRPTEPAGPRKILRGGKLEIVPAEPGYYEQALKSSLAKDSQRDSTNLQMISSDIPYDISNVYSQGLDTSTSSLLQSAYSTNKNITEQDNQRYEQSSSVSENIATLEKTGSDGKPIRTSTSSRQVMSSSDGTPFSTTPREPAGPRNIIRGGKLEHIPAEKGYYDQVSRTQDFNTSTTAVSESEYSTNQFTTEQDNKRFEQTSKKSGHTATFEKTGTDGKPIRAATSSREVLFSSDGTPIGDVPREPEGPKKIIRGGKLEYIPAEPGYYDSIRRTQDLNASTKVVSQSEYSTKEFTTEQDNQRFEQTSKISEQTSLFEKTGPDGKPVRTGTSSREVLFSSDGTPIGSVPREPEGPKKIIRGGKLEHIPAEPGYYDSIRRTQDFNTSSTAVSQSEYSTNQLITEQDNQRFEQTTKVSDQTASFEKTGRDGKPIKTGTSSREVMYSSDGTPIGGVPREPEGPKKIIRGGKLEYIPAEPGYYDQTRRTQDVHSTTAVSQSEYSTNQLITEKDNQRFQKTSKLSEHTASLEKTGPDGKPIRTSTSSREVMLSTDGTPTRTIPSQTEPAGPKKILRGGKLEYIPAEPGYYKQALKPKGSPKDSKVFSTSRTTGQQEISESERIIEESSTSLKHLGEQLTDDSRVPGTRKPTRGGKKPGNVPTNVVSRSSHIDDFSSENIHETSSSTIDERSSTSRFIDNVTDISEHTTTIVRPGPRPTQVRGSNFETMSSGTIHDYGDVQGITVVSQSKTTMDQTVDQKQAQAELQKLTTAKSVYGVDIESTLARSRVKAVHEKEISSGTVRIGHSGVETTENVVKSVTEIKTARVSSATSKDTVEIDEKVLSSTTSSDQHTFKFSEITDKQAQSSLTDVRRRNDIMNRTGTHESIDYTDTYKNQLDKKEVLKTGQVLVEELYDTKTSFESMDKDRVKSRAVQDENLRTTTILEKSEDTNKPEPEPYGPITRVTPIRQPSNLILEGSVDYTSTNRTDYNQKSTDRVKAVRRNTYTKQEGEMYLQTTSQSQFTQQIGDRYDAKKPVDQITVPEGTFSKRPEDKVFPKGERAEVHRTPDNLRPEGDFYGKPKEEAPKMGDRAPIKRPVDNLTSSGDKFYERPKEEAPTRGERAPVKKPVDQFPVSEGPFYVRPTETHGPGERREPIRQKDNLRPEGKFHSPTKEAAPTMGDRAEKRIPKDQITMPEGAFSKRPQDQVVPKGERAEKVYHKDTTFFEGKFEDSTTSQRDFRQVVGERAEVYRTPDNLRPEGQFYVRPKEDAPTGEKRKPIKQQDNLYPEGQFYSPTKEAAPLKGDRADIKKPVDQIGMSTADFTKRPTDAAPTGEKRQPIKQHDNLYPEGQFYAPAKEPAPTRGDRADIKKPVDQIGMSTADFTKRPDDVFPTGEKRHPIKQHDNLYPEGQFYSPEKQPAPLKGDRADIKRPVDQIGMSTADFTRRPEDVIPTGEKRKPIKQNDNLYPEGQFYSPTKEPAPLRGDRADIKKPVDQIGMSKADFTKRPEDVVPAGEKRRPIKQQDNLYPEGQFYSPEKQPAPLKGDRADIKKPVDQIGMSTADFTKRPEDVFPTGEKRQPIKQHDNLYPEGQFYSPTKEPAPLRGDRADIKKPVDQIGMSTADFTKRPDDVFPTGEKRKPIKQYDNLYPEGQFYAPHKEAAPLKGDRADIKKPVDQIGMSTADFTKRTQDVVPTGEKRKPIKQQDNLYPEGQFYSPAKEPVPLKGDRADIKKPVDQIGMSTADFTKRPDDVVPTGEKRKPIKQQDNLYPEGQFYSPEKQPAPLKGDRADIKKPVDQIGMSTADFTKRPEDVVPTGEKRKPIKQHDNLYPEGQFYSPEKQPAPLKGDRADIKRPVDQIGMSTADFTKRPEDVVPTGEKRKPIKQHDNLYPEGQFYSPEKQPAPLKGDRADVKRPVDQIGMSTADFTKRPDEVFPTGEKRQPIKQHDNLYPEGQFYSPEKQPAPLKGDRADIKRPVDQIGMSTADFTKRPEDSVPTGEKRRPIKQQDNLYPEGQFYTPDKAPAPTRGERADIKKPVDQIGMSTADFTKRPEDVFPTGEKRQPIKQHDNLYPEGQFYSPTKEPAPLKGDRADIKKPVDQIGMSTADFTRRPEDVVPTGEKRRPIKQQDNLYPEGQFYSPEKQPAPLKGDRADIKKPVDQIGMSTADFTRRPEEVIPTGEKRRPIKQQDNLYPEGQFYSPDKAPAPTRGERADVKRPVDQIGMSTADFTKRPEEVFPTGEKRQPIKQHDNLYPEGQFYSPTKEAAPLKGDRADIKKPVDQIGMSTAEFTKRPEEVFPTGEKRQPIKQHDNLYPEGQFYSPTKEPAPTRGERADIKKPVDQIGMSTADFTKRPEEVFPTGEKRQPIKQHDNLYPEGQFYSPTKEAAPLKGERADIKKPVDQIGMSTADFTKRPEEAFPTGERRQPIKQHDNLYPEGQFYSPAKEPAPLKGDRADIKKPVDQIGMSTADFTKRPEEEFPTGEKRRPIKQQDNLYPEGQFYSPEKQPAPLKGDRADIKKPVDQIGMSTADFTKRQTDTVVMRGERAEKVYHKDATFFEGKFDETTTSQRDYRQVVGERAEVHRTPDNLRPEGQFYVRPKEDAPAGEKRQPIRQQDNLYPEGQFYSPTKEAAPLKGDRAEIKKPVDQIGISKADFTKRPEDIVPAGEKRRPIKQQDNLYPEGQFYSPTKEAAPLKGDRADIKKPVDQIGMSTADFTRRPEDVVPTGEKRKPIKQNDNLYPEGQFYSPDKQPAPLKGDRADVKKPVDQIGMSKADFARRPEEVIPNGERRQLIKQPDTLHPEGKFYTPERQPAPGPGERADVVKPKDQFHMPDGDFTQRPDHTFPHGEKRSPIRQRDNLRPEGQMYSPTKDTAPKIGERATIKKPVDNLKTSDAKFYEKPKETSVNGERRAPLKQVDNLHVEGDFYERPKETAYVRGERAETVIHEDTLRMEGKFHDATTSRDDYQQYTGERAGIVRHKDQLVTEGRFTGTSTSHEEHRQFTGQRAETVRHEDNLRTTGDFYQRPVDEAPKGERRQPIRHKDNLFPEGKHYMPDKAPAPGPGDRANIKKPVDNLKTPEGKFAERPKENVPITERRTQIRHEDSLKVEGEFYKRPKSPTVVKGERAPVKKPVDNLRLEGKMDILDKTMVVRKGERAETIRHKDNLTVGEGSMDLESITRSQQRESLRSKTHSATINQQQSHQQHSRDVVRKQTSSQIILGDEASDARFERTTTGKRNTVETRNLSNGHMLQEKSIESSVRHTAETRATEDRSVEQKLLSQSMSAKSTVNQSIVLNDVNQTQRQAAIESNKLVSSSQTDSVNQVSATSASRQSSETRTQQQLQANKTGTREVQVTREVTVTKRHGEPGPGPRALPGTATTTQNRSSSSTVTDQSSAHHMSQQQMNLSSSTHQHQQVQESQGGHSLSRTHGTSGRGVINGEPSGSAGTNRSSSQNQTQSLSNIQEGRVSSSMHEAHSTSAMRQNAAASSHSQIIQGSVISSPAGSPRNAASGIGRSSPQPQSLSNIQEGRATTSSATRESQSHSSNVTSSSVNKNTSASTHSRIIHGSSGSQGNAGDWSTRDNAAGSDAFATSLRSGGIQTTSNLSGAGNTLVIRHADIVDSRRVGGSANSHSHSTTTGHCAIHSPQSRSAAGVRTSQHTQATTSIGYSNNQQPSNNSRDNSYNNNVQNGSRSQRTVRNDNLSLSSQKFEGQTSSNYGHFQMTERVVPVRSTQQSSISLGSYGSSASPGHPATSSYKKEFTQRKVEPCPASLLESVKSPFKYERQSSSHRFYMPNVSD